MTATSIKYCLDGNLCCHGNLSPCMDIVITLLPKPLEMNATTTHCIGQLYTKTAMHHHRLVMQCMLWHSSQVVLECNPD